MGYAMLKRGTYTPQEYLELERQAPFKSEYINGHIYPMVDFEWDSVGIVTMMAGASPNHNTLTVNSVLLLGTQLRGTGCRTWSQDLRVKVPDTELYTYPDVLVVCPPQEWDDQQKDTLVNPVILIEVLSPSTAEYDRDAKWEHYRRITSLRHYLLIDQQRFCIEHYYRTNDDTWLYERLTDPSETIHLKAIGCTLPLAELYEDVEFSNP